MTRKTVYICDLCKQEFRSKGDVIGFSCSTSAILGEGIIRTRYDGLDESNNNCHICEECKLFIKDNL